MTGLCSVSEASCPRLVRRRLAFASIAFSLKSELVPGLLLVGRLFVSDCDCYSLASQNREVMVVEEEVPLHILGLLKSARHADNS